MWMETKIDPDLRLSSKVLFLSIIPESIGLRALHRKVDIPVSMVDFIHCSESALAENIYAVQGLGTLSLKAATKPDPLLLLTLTVFITFVVALVSLIRDVLEIFIDPRIRKQTAEGG